MKDIINYLLHSISKSMGQTVRENKEHIKKQFWCSNTGSKIKKIGRKRKQGFIPITITINTLMCHWQCLIRDWCTFLKLPGISQTFEVTECYHNGINIFLTNVEGKSR